MLRDAAGAEGIARRGDRSGLALTSGRGVDASADGIRCSSWERLVKKGRHRRFEEARSLKRAMEVVAEPCPECGAEPEEEHASWCLYESEELDEEDAEEPRAD